MSKFSIEFESNVYQDFKKAIMEREVFDLSLKSDSVDIKSECIPDAMALSMSGKTKISFVEIMRLGQGKG